MSRQTAQLLRASLELLLRDSGAVVGDSCADEYRVVLELATALPGWRKDEES